MGGTYGSRLAESAGWTPVFLRVNTGLSVAENGVALTALLQELVETWPVEVRRIALVGHSMGGLIIRAGCAVATDHARAVAATSSPTSSPSARRTSAPTSRWGSATARASWRCCPRSPASAGSSSTARRASATSSAACPSCRRCPHVATAWSRRRWARERSPVGAALRRPARTPASATGLRRSLRLFPDADVLHVANADHFALLNHPEVDYAMAGWLA